MTLSPLRFRFAALLMILIGVLDWLTGTQISFALFYLIPLIWFARSVEHKIKPESVR